METAFWIGVILCAIVIAIWLVLLGMYIERNG